MVRRMKKIYFHNIFFAFLFTSFLPNTFLSDKHTEIGVIIAHSNACIYSYNVPFILVSPLLHCVIIQFIILGALHGEGRKQQADTVKYIQAFLQIFFDGEPKDITSYNQKH
jgi:hypothetical protein